MAGLKVKTFDFEVKGDMIEVGFWDGKLVKFTSAVDLKEFYSDLHYVLLNNKLAKFYDMLGTPKELSQGKFFGYGTKKGEHTDVDRYRNRPGDMFEKKFVWNRQNDGTIEFETEWMAYSKSRYSGFGWMELKIDLVCRRLEVKEFLIDNKKKKLQVGTWEFRNRIKYKNTIIRDLLNKIPIVRKSDFLKKVIIENIYLKDIQDDLDDTEYKMAGLIKQVMAKHFT